MIYGEDGVGTVAQGTLTCACPVPSPHPVLPYLYNTTHEVFYLLAVVLAWHSINTHGSAYRTHQYGVNRTKCRIWAAAGIPRRIRGGSERHPRVADRNLAPTPFAGSGRCR